jgi:Mrp family chromosome partitioning ATPase
MERIQSAIEKARAARQQRDPQPKAGGGSLAAAARPAGKPQVDAAVSTESDPWMDLVPFEPDHRTLEAHRVVAYKSGPAAIPFDVMRTKLLYQLRSNNWKRIAVTSPSSGCGKTMVCLNLAFSLSRQADIRILVVELDLRRPSMAKVLGLHAKSLFARVLEGGAPAEAHMVRCGTNLIFATNHSPARNPAELLQGAGSAAVLDEIEARYRPDVMIFDMPPMLVNDDTIAFIDQVDCALLVGAAEKSSIDEIDRCEQELSARTQVMGVVLNKCRYLEMGESYEIY